MPYVLNISPAADPAPRGIRGGEIKMTNHPNRTPAYEVRHNNGRFATVRGKAAALALARAQSGGDAASEDDLRSEWGVRITRLSSAEARARGV